jgi:hypothetical protein
LPYTKRYEQTEVQVMGEPWAKIRDWWWGTSDEGLGARLDFRVSARTKEKIHTLKRILGHDHTVGVFRFALALLELCVFHVLKGGGVYLVDKADKPYARGREVLFELHEDYYEDSEEPDPVPHTTRLALDPQAGSQLERLQEASGLDDPTDTVRWALSVAENMIQFSQGGVYQETDGEEEGAIFVVSKSQRRKTQEALMEAKVLHTQFIPR